MSTTNRPNWVEIGTLILATIGVIGGGWRFLAVDRQLGRLGIELQTEERDYKLQESLQVRGQVTLPCDYDHPHSDWTLATIELDLENLRRANIEVTRIDFKVIETEVPGHLCDHVDVGKDDSGKQENRAQIVVIEAKSPGDQAIETVATATKM